MVIHLFAPARVTKAATPRAEVHPTRAAIQAKPGRDGIFEQSPYRIGLAVVRVSVRSAIRFNDRQFSRIDTRVLIRLIGSVEIPDGGDEETQSPRGIEGYLPSEIHHDPSRDWRCDGRANTNATNRQTDRQPMLSRRRPVCNRAVKIGQGHGLADADEKAKRQ